MNAAHEHVEWGAGVTLAKVCGGESADKTANGEAAHGLVAKAEAAVGVAAHDELPPFYDTAVFIDGEGAGPERFPSAPGKDAEVVGILEVFSKHDVTYVEHRGQL